MIHRDIAARNVLVFGHDQVKIGDFGLAREVDRDMIYEVKTNRPLRVRWMAPDAYEEEKFTFMCK